MTGGTPARYVGMLRSAASWAKVGRELVTALDRLGEHVCVDERSDDRYDPTFDLSPELTRIVARSGPCGVPDDEHATFTFAAPTDYARLPLGPAAVGLLAWEATTWPAEWLRAGERWTRRLVVPSSFPARTLVASGFPDERVGVVPHGVDPDVYHPGDRRPAGSRRDLTVLFVGTPARRKGLDALVGAMRSAFPSGRGVRLVVKMVPYADEAARPYLDQEWRARLAGLAGEGHRVRVIDEVVPEEGMARLYRAADLLCHPFRGECFPLPFLEAMACGTPVLCTDWSGPPDLIDGSVGLLVGPAGLVPAAPLLPEPRSVPADALMAEPDVAATAHVLARVAADRAELAGLGRRAHERATAWTWEAAAERLITELVRAREAA